MKLEVDPVDHENVFVPVPPLAKPVAVPLELPLQVLLVARLMVSAFGCVIVMDSKSSHPFVSETVTVYVPAVNPLMLEDVPPVFQEYEIDPLPPETLADAVPLFPPKHETLVPETLTEGPVVTITLTEAVSTQPAAVDPSTL